jgi:hypothetical protein
MNVPYLDINVGNLNMNICNIAVGMRHIEASEGNIGVKIISVCNSSGDNIIKANN